MTQAEQILAHLERRGSINPLEALDRYGCFRLAARIADLKAEGHNITSEPFKTPKGATVARYRLVNSEAQQELAL